MGKYSFKEVNMLGETIFDRTTIPVLTKTLDASMLRSRTIANNIANINTPGYQRVEVNFEDELKKALEGHELQGMRTDDKHLPLGQSNISELNATVSKPVDPTLPSGVNNVDIENEMAKLAETQIEYNFAAKFLKGKFSALNAAIQQKTIQ
jgi:flagellar basal-body rod protein FlgB